MLFNSIEFAIFLPIVFFLYWFVFNKSLKLQNLLIVGSSFLFYGWWDWRFLFLMIFSASIDYIVGIMLSKNDIQRKRKILLAISILVNLSILVFFKYFNFFVDSFVSAFSFFGTKLNPVTLKIVLPLGISFYTFQAMSYTIEVYRKNLKPTESFVDYFAFISFFPQLVAGPIERATNLLPQFYTKRTFDYDKAIDGMRQMLWGLFKKIAVADNLSKIVEPIFDSPQQMSTITLLLGIAAFSVQIYADFSGYSDIAIGVSRLFGFNLMRNFRYPLFARSVGERWRNWHISLSTWFRDYIYIPLGGSRGSKWNKFKNTMILFTISGFWHGANWTFVCWGIINGLFFAPSMLLNTNRKYLEPISKKRFFPNVKEFFQMFTTFWLIASTYIFFRADDILHSKQYFVSLFLNWNISRTINFISDNTKILFYSGLFAVIMLIFEWINRDKPHGLFFEKAHSLNIVRWTVYYIIIILIIKLGGNQETFIYFQF
jgi:D-alanyl-lipoteichoic acid acyltransferase DltB (MBOAT superfamily)